ncbi:MAG: P-loop NTPase [Acidimicrobiia bacterium]|nr:P-loop NTPase [Acidimicrobiia bacterium]NNF68771.1 P-loop NTPase [Acidimicrobiia bacterium]
MLDNRLVVVSGKGGVGKSAVTAGLALKAAAHGARVLVIGMTEPLGLAEHVGVERLTYEAREVHPGISALAIDRPAALDEYIRLQLRVPRAAPTAQLTRALTVLAETAPGIREIITMGKPVFEVWASRWDHVIVDAPPLGQLASYLRAPQAVASIVPAGRIRDQAMAMADVLNSDCELILVATASELPVNETLEAVALMKAESLVPVTGVIANRVVEPLDIAARTVARLPDGPHRGAVELHMAVAEDQTTWLAELSPTFTIPYLFGLLTPYEVAARIGDLLEAA